MDKIINFKKYSLLEQLEREQSQIICVTEDHISQNFQTFQKSKSSNYQYFQ